MDKVENLQDFEQIKVLADSHRLDILRRLMTKSATLTELGQMLGKSAAWVQHHLKVLETAGLVEVTEIHTTARLTRKYYKAKSSALVLQKLIMPRSQKPVIIFSGSHDPAIEIIAAHLTQHISFLTSSVDSLDSLIHLRQGLCHVAGTHMLDASGVYNAPFVRRLFLDRAVTMFTLSHRIQGLIVAPGNPKGLKTPLDLIQSGVTLINRNPSSETRLWLDQELTRLGVPTTLIRGFENFVSTNSAAAQAVQAGKADVAIGIQAAAWEAQLDFIPLFEERYDLVVNTAQIELVNPLLDYIQSDVFRKELSLIPGYNTTYTGEQIHL